MNRNELDRKAYFWAYKLLPDYIKILIEMRGKEKYYLVKFSEKEIEEIKKKFDTDLADFELVEVVE